MRGVTARWIQIARYVIVAAMIATAAAAVQRWYDDDPERAMQRRVDEYVRQMRRMREEYDKDAPEAGVPRQGGTIGHVPF